MHYQWYIPGCRIVLTLLKKFLPFLPRFLGDHCDIKLYLGPGPADSWKTFLFAFVKVYLLPYVKKIDTTL